jgi:hypothetical protein
VSIDDVNKSITVNLDTWSDSEIHSLIAVRPETDSLDAPGLDVDGTTYAVRVLDWKNAELYTGSITTLLAP